jgi:hypothetical protein
VHALIAPSIGRSHITVSVDSLSTAAPQRLISRSLPNAFYFSAVVVVADETAAIIVLHIKVTFMATDTMKRRWSLQIGKERGKIGQCLWGSCR